MLSFLNVFVVPVITLSIYSRRFGVSIEKNAKTLVHYCISVIWVTIMTYVAIELMKTLVGIAPILESHLYTIIASVVAFVLPYCYEIYKKYVDIRCEIKKRGIK